MKTSITHHMYDITIYITRRKSELTQNVASNEPGINEPIL